MGVESGNGFEAWRQLKRDNRPRSNAANRGRLHRITKPEHIVIATTSVRDRIRKWERELKEYEDISFDEMQESIRMGVLQDVLVDPELRRHLIIIATRIFSYAEMKNEVEAALDSLDGMDPMSVSAKW